MSLSIPSHAGGVPVVVVGHVKSGETIDQYDFVTLSSGYIAQAAAGDKPYGVALGKVETAPTTSGAVTIAIDVATETVYWRAVGTGTAAITMIGRTCDLAGAATADVTASTDDILLIQDVDVTNNRVLVSRLNSPSGVV